MPLQPSPRLFQRRLLAGMVTAALILTSTPVWAADSLDADASLVDV